jgi:hypothetical protein
MIAARSTARLFARRCRASRSDLEGRRRWLLRSIPYRARTCPPGSLTDLIEGGIEAGAFGTADPPLTAMLLCSALHLAFDRIRHQDVPYETARLSAAVRELVRRALEVDPAIRGSQRRTP